MRHASERKGDAGELVADSSKTRKALGSEQNHDDREEIYKFALEWERESVHGQQANYSY